MASSIIPVCTAAYVVYNQMHPETHAYVRQKAFAAIDQVTKKYIKVPKRKSISREEAHENKLLPVKPYNQGSTPPGDFVPCASNKQKNKHFIQRLKRKKVFIE